MTISLNRGKSLFETFFILGEEAGGSIGVVGYGKGDVI